MAQGLLLPLGVLEKRHFGDDSFFSSSAGGVQWWLVVVASSSLKKPDGQPVAAGGDAVWWRPLPVAIKISVGEAKTLAEREGEGETGMRKVGRSLGCRS